MEKEETIKRLNKFHPERHKCMICGEDIIYDNTSVGERGKIQGKSYQTIKKVGDVEYKLQVCQRCLLKKYPNIKNLSRTFNVMSEMTKFAFQIPDKVFEDSRAKYAMTEKHMIEKYGKEAGQKKWDEYCKKQAETNTFEYKQKTYGWTKEQFDEYNQNRACTLENFINRWGKEEGQKKWDKYVNRQKETKSEAYVIKKYGKQYWIDLCNKKLKSIEEFSNRNYSKISQEFFDILDDYLGSKYKTEYATKNSEHKLLIDNHYAYLDYYIPELNLAVEFNGSAWHGDPNKYKPEDHCFPCNEDITAKELQDIDNNRYKRLKELYNIDTVVVWESEYSNEFDFKKFIKEKLNIDLCSDQN